MVGLTVEEIRKLPKVLTSKITTRPEVVAKAQIKKVGEWGDKACRKHPTCETTVLLRRECEECWQALLEEVKDSGDNDH